jgi:glucose-1-phosphate thymidylyltransferase
MSPLFGILPAAGLGSRLGSFPYPKELMPVSFRRKPDGGAVPFLLIEHSLEAMRLAGVHQCAVVISERKPEVLRYLGDGRAAGLSLCYLVQTEPRGLADAVDQGHNLVKALGASVCLALPDTRFQPVTAMRAIVEEMERSRAELVLAVFPTKTASELGPVRIGAGGVVEAVFDKPASTELRNTWGIATWRPLFSELVHEAVASAGPAQANLGLLFQEAVRAGLRVRAVKFDAGLYEDLGTEKGLARFVDGPDRGPLAGPE